MTNLGYHSLSSPKPYFKDEAKLPQVKHSIAPGEATNLHIRALKLKNWENNRIKREPHKAECNTEFAPQCSIFTIFYRFFILSHGILRLYLCGIYDCHYAENLAA